MEIIVTVIWAILAAAAFYASYYLFESWQYLRKVNLIPTKKPNPILGHMMFFLGPRNQFLEKMHNIVKENTDLFTIWLGPVPILILVQPKHVEVILNSTKLITKSFQYRFIDSWIGEGLVTSKGAKWQTHRKMITPTFHFSILENYLEVMAEKCQILVKKLDKQVGSESFDIFPYIGKCALDVICKTAMGTEINAQETTKKSEYVNAVCETTFLIMERAFTPWLFPDWTFNISSLGRSYHKNVKTMKAFTNKVIQERKQAYFQKMRRPSHTVEEDDIGRKKRLNFLDLLIEQSENGNKLTDEELREEVDTFMFAGHDTTTASIAWNLQMLASHPDIQEKVYEEIDGIFQGSDRTPTMADISEMKYLERVIKETARMYPPVPLIGRNITEDVTLDGITVPKGMRTLLFIPCTHRIAEHFPDPNTFNPDNFLPEKSASRHPYSYIPFSAGPRNCVGQKFAVLEEKTMLSYILRHYKVEATGDLPTPLPDIILRPENGIRIRIKPR